MGGRQRGRCASLVQLSNQFSGVGVLHADAVDANLASVLAHALELPVEWAWESPSPDRTRTRSRPLCCRLLKGRANPLDSALLGWAGSVATTTRGDAPPADRQRLHPCPSQSSSPSRRAVAVKLALLRSGLSVGCSGYWRLRLGGRTSRWPSVVAGPVPIGVLRLSPGVRRSPGLLFAVSQASSRVDGGCRAAFPTPPLPPPSSSSGVYTRLCPHCRGGR